MHDPFVTLGVPRRFSLSRADLEQRHRDLSRALHPDRYAQAPASERRVALERAVAVNEAFRALRDPLTRAQSLLALYGAAVDERARAAPSLLMEVMELRESLESARGDDAKVARLRETVNARITEEERTVADAFDRDDAPDAAALERARAAVASLRYLHRFMEEADDHDA